MLKRNQRLIEFFASYILPCCRQKKKGKLGFEYAVDVEFSGFLTASNDEESPLTIGLLFLLGNKSLREIPSG